MRKFVHNFALLSATILLAIPATTNAGEQIYDGKEVIVTNPDTVGSVFFSGLDAREYSWYTHAGTIMALNGDLGKSGLYFRAFGGGGQYNYDTGTPLNLNIEGTLLDADMGLGYRYLQNGWVFGVYTGLHVRDRSFNQIDPGNLIGGTDIGARFLADATGTTGPIWWNGIAQFSTVDSAWWTRARVGYEINRFKIGPEFIYQTDVQFVEYRIGAFVSTQLTDRCKATVSLGAANYENSRGATTSDDSLYGSLGFSFLF